MILKAVDSGTENSIVSGVTKQEWGRLVRHAINFGYIHEGKADTSQLPLGASFTLVVPPIELGSLTPRGKRYLEHLRKEFEQ